MHATLTAESGIRLVTLTRLVPDSWTSNLCFHTNTEILVFGDLFLPWSFDLGRSPVFVSSSGNIKVVVKAPAAPQVYRTTLTNEAFIMLVLKTSVTKPCFRPDIRWD